MSLFEQHSEILDKAIEALKVRSYFVQYPEHPRAYGPEALQQGTSDYEAQLGNPFEGLLQEGQIGTCSEEVSPYTLKSLGISYPTFEPDALIAQATAAQKQWSTLHIERKTGLLIEALEQTKNRFHEIALATQHTNGQSYGFAFQFGGPNAAERALEAIALAYLQINNFESKSTWSKSIGSSQINLEKTFVPIPKGVSLVFGSLCNPTLYAIPAIFANLITGNVCIVKPHPQSVYPLAVFVSELQKVFLQDGVNPHTVQLATEESGNSIEEIPIGETLAQNPSVKIIDYVGNSAFAKQLKSLENKTTFTAQSVVNSVVIDSADDLRVVMRNLAFSACLYSGQMCTSPQNFFIPAEGIPQKDGTTVSYDEAIDLLQNEMAALALNPKMGAGILGALQSKTVLEQSKSNTFIKGKTILEAPQIQNKMYPLARFRGPSLTELQVADKDIYFKEHFGPTFFVVKTDNTEHSVQLAKEIAEQTGSIQCALYCTDEEKTQTITAEINEVGIPVVSNFIGFAFANEQAAFSDFHGPLGSPDFISGRFSWVSNRGFVTGKR